MAVEEYVSEGYSVKVAQLFDINLNIFPCLVIFQDIRSNEHITITLKGIDAGEISSLMRAMFSMIRKAVSQKKNPISVLEKQRRNEKFRKAGQTIIGEIQSLTGKTFETAVEALVKAQIK